MWIGPSLASSFFRLQEEFGWHEFTLGEAAQVLPGARPSAALVLSRLARAGWLVRLERGRYVALDGRWALERPKPDLLESFRTEPFFRSLVHATAGALQIYGSRLRSIGLFGSAARRTHTLESDVDLLLVADRLPALLGDRLAELGPLRYEDRATYPVQFVPLSLPELAAEPPLLLDLTEDAVILFDPDRHLRRSLDRLARKLKSRGARRVQPAGGPPFWLLSPGARIGEVSEL